MPADQQATIAALVAALLAHNQANVVNAPASNSLCAVTSPAPTALDPMGYCWTHGSTLNSSHNSCTCLKRADGHQEQATVSNKMGGSTNVQHLRPTRPTSA
jgi:hypothetical protein